jgi:hypothetical protein
MSDAVASHRPPGPAPLSVSAGITAGGTLYWMGIVWAVTLVICLLVLVTAGLLDAELDDSLWQGLGAGWQRWLVLAAGVTMMPAFGPILITNGATRRRLAESAVVTLALVALGGALVIVAGYVVEDVVFAANGWPHMVDDRSAGGIGFLAAVALEGWVSLAAYFVSGWLIGIGFYRFNNGVAVPLILPSLAPAVAANLLVQSRIGNGGPMDFVFASFDVGRHVPVVLGVMGSLAVTALACVVAARYTRGVALNP